jgi:hypothetical protein
MVANRSFLSASPAEEATLESEFRRFVRPNWEIVASRACANSVTVPQTHAGTSGK